MPHAPLLRTLIGDVCVLEDMTVHLPVIEIRIVECRGGASGCSAGQGPWLEMGVAGSECGQEEMGLVLGQR